VALYKLAAAYLRAYANLANEMREAGYTDAEVATIKGEVDHYEKVRQEVKLASGDYVDMKMFEPAMRHLLDTYIRAEESEKVSAFDNLTLVELIVKRGEAAVDTLPEGLRRNREAMAETIENNVRRLIIDEMAINPKYYEKMSELLDALIEQRRREALDYQAYLKKIVELSRQVSNPDGQSSYPAAINTSPLRALYDNLEAPVPAATAEVYSGRGAAEASAGRQALAIALDYSIRAVKKADWRGNRFKEREVWNAIKSKLGENPALVDRIFEIVKAQREY
jgi:type I restriction enzyme R subunit